MRIHRICGACLISAIILASSVVGSDVGEKVINQIRMESYRNHLVNDLYTALFMDRSCGDGPYGPLARDRVVELFESYGLEVTRLVFEDSNGPGEDIIATLPGTLFPDSYYLVSAHLDNVANGGADDNASGVAALLELARVLAPYEIDTSIRFIVTDYEECGLDGAFVYCLAYPDDDVLGVVNIDMIAWDCGRRQCRLFGSDQSLDLRNAVADSFVEYQVDVQAGVAGEMPYGTSDHAVFDYFGYPALVVMEREYQYNPYLHNFHDTIDLPGYPHYGFATEIVRGIAGFLADAAGARPPADCNGNGEADVLEIQNNPALDCNGNHVLDECEFAGNLDANGNQVPDLCDISSGTSGDCNGNWIPDEAEDSYTEDCNQNGVPDLCEVADFSVRDFNHNGIPDVCEGLATIYVDDDAPDDPGPNDPTVSDPLENGTGDHPFDALDEAIAAALEGDEIVLLPGTYSGAPNQNLQFYAKAITIRGTASNPRECRLTPNNGSTLFVFDFLEGRNTVLRDLTIANGSRANHGIVFCDGGDPTFVNCIFENNTVSRGSGGAVALSSSRARFINCLFTGNRARGNAFGDGNGGAVGVNGGAPEFINCTFVNNHADDAGGTIYSSSGRIRIWNSILFGGTATDGAEIALNGGELTLGFSDLVAGPGSIWESSSQIDWGAGNLVADPGFLDALNADYHLGPLSPCIDAGCNVRLPADWLDLDEDGDVLEPLSLDLDAAGRFVDDPNTVDTGCGGTPFVDMGVFEFGDDAQQPCLGDFNGDRRVNLRDLAHLLGAYGHTAAGDMNCDGETGMDDLAELLSRYGNDCP